MSRFQVSEVLRSHINTFTHLHVFTENLSLWWIRYLEGAGPKEIKDSEYILGLASGNVIKLSRVRTKGSGAYFQDNKKCHWRRKWQPTPVFLPGESQGQGSLTGCCPWAVVAQSRTRLKWLSSSSSIHLKWVNCMVVNYIKLWHSKQLPGKTPVTLHCVSQANIMLMNTLLATKKITTGLFEDNNDNGILFCFQLSSFEGNAWCRDPEPEMARFTSNLVVRKSAGD